MPSTRILVPSLPRGTFGQDTGLYACGPGLQPAARDHQVGQEVAAIDDLGRERHERQVDEGGAVGHAELGSGDEGREARPGEGRRAGRQARGGLEQQFDDILTGTPGELTLEQDPAGRTIPIGQHSLVPAVKGEDVVLTLDRSLLSLCHQFSEIIRAVGRRA